jgi:hypothetical protein
MDIIGAIIVGLVILVIVTRGFSTNKGYKIDWEKEETEHRKSFISRNKDVYPSEKELNDACDLEFKAIRDTQKRFYDM